MLETTKRNLLSIETERLKIYEKDDYLEGLEAVFSDAKTMHFYPQFMAGVKMGIKPFLDLLEKSGVYVYPLVLNETEQIVGLVTLNNVEETCKRIEVGYFLSSNYWKKGYAREILSAMITFLRDQKWHRIEATVYSGNEASQKVLEVCGFTLEGVLRDKYLIHGKYHDDIIYSIIN
jgi:ribosomal-protein-alanine N-acetyltransferase